MNTCLPRMSGMGAKKPNKKDRHLEPKITLRLPSPAGDILRQIAAKEDRTITTVVLRALRLYAEQNGHSWQIAP